MSVVAAHSVFTLQLLFLLFSVLQALRFRSKNEDRVLGLRFSFSLVFVFVTPAALHDEQTKYFRNFRKLVSDIPIFSCNDE